MVERRAHQCPRCAASAITGEVWEAVNEGWMTMRDLLARPVRESNLGTALARDPPRSDAGARRHRTVRCCATRSTASPALGTFVERADNTARILDMKYYVLLPSLSYVGTALDTGQWDNVLRSLSGERAYRWLNAGRMDARSIADFLILDERFPRSLAFCYTAHARTTSPRSAQLHGHEGQCQRLMREADQRLTEHTIDDIFDQGLHEFLLEFIAGNRPSPDASPTIIASSPDGATSHAPLDPPYHPLPLRRAGRARRCSACG